MFTWSEVRSPGRPADTVVLRWQAHPCWPVTHNAGRALALLRAGGRPVLLVRGAQGRPYRHALFPTALTPSSLDRLRCAVRTLPRTRFTLLHACRVNGEGSMRSAGIGDATLEACRRRTERAARAAGYRFVAQLPSRDARRLVLRVLALRQPWAAAVAAHAGLAQPDLLVLGDAGGGVCADWRWRTDLRALLRRTACDLLLLPHARRS